MRSVVYCLALTSGILTSCADQVSVQWPVAVQASSPNKRRLNELSALTPQPVASTANPGTPDGIRPLAGVWRGCIGGGCAIPAVIAVGSLNASGAEVSFDSIETRRYKAQEAHLRMDFLSPNELQGGVSSSYKLKLRARPDGNMDAMVVTPELWRGGVWGSHWEVGVLKRD
jgi:hypothetical protein